MIISQKGANRLTAVKKGTVKPIWIRSSGATPSTTARLLWARKVCMMLFAHPSFFRLAAPVATQEVEQGEHGGADGEQHKQHVQAECAEEQAPDHVHGQWAAEQKIKEAVHFILSLFHCHES